MAAFELESAFNFHLDEPSGKNIVGQKMNERTNSGAQFIDIFGVIVAVLCCPIGFAAGAWNLWEHNWAAGIILLAFTFAFGAGAVAAFRRFRDASATDRAFEKKHRGALDWKGDPIERDPRT